LSECGFINRWDVISTNQIFNLYIVDMYGLAGHLL